MRLISRRVISLTVCCNRKLLTAGVGRISQAGAVNLSRSTSISVCASNPLQCAPACDSPFINTLTKVMKQLAAAVLFSYFYLLVQRYATDFILRRAIRLPSADNQRSKITSFALSLRTFREGWNFGIIDSKFVLVRACETIQAHRRQVL
jgi:hypothetical protein